MRNFKVLSRLFFSMFVVLFAMGILLTSIFRSAQIRYSFEPLPTASPKVLGEDSRINYELPYPGKVGPDSLLWPLKVTRDKFWLTMTTNPLKRAEISLLFANKRLASALVCFDEGESEQAISTLQKAELYLNKSLDYTITAGDENMDTSVFLQQLAQASLKHREVLEKFIDQAPDDAKPLLVSWVDNSKEVFNKTIQELNERGHKPPDNPFDQP